MVVNPLGPELKKILKSLTWVSTSADQSILLKPSNQKPLESSLVNVVPFTFKSKLFTKFGTT